jgi:hypothetical protein
MIEIEEVTMFKYVGTWISITMTNQMQWTKRQTQVSAATGRLLAGGLAPRYGYPVLLRVMAFEAVVTSTLVYNTEVWARTDARYRQIYRVWSVLMKSILGIRAYAQVKPIIVKVVQGLLPVNIQVEMMLLKYWWDLTQTPEGHRERRVLRGVWKEAKGDSWAANVQRVCDKWRL